MTSHRSKSLMIYTASGFRTDIETLFAKYDDKNSTKYLDFCHDFQDMSFGLIFRGRHNDNEMHEFIDEIYLEVLSQLVNKERPLSQRVCSLYLLYAIYVKQPLDQSLKTRFDVKVRITLDQLHTIRQFIDQCKRNGIVDAVYVWYKLLSSGVHFVFYRYKCIGPSNTRSINYYLFQSSHSSTDKAINDLKESLETRFDTLETNHNLFVDYKEKVFDGSERSVEEKPNVINHDLWKDSMANLHKLVNDFKYITRDPRGRGRPSIWTPYRSEDDSQNGGDNNDLTVKVKKKAIKSKEKVETEGSSHILWTEDIIKEIKERKIRLKSQKKDTKQKQTNKKTKQCARKPTKAKK